MGLMNNIGNNLGNIATVGQMTGINAGISSVVENGSKAANSMLNTSLFGFPPGNGHFLPNATYGSGGFGGFGGFGSSFGGGFGFNSAFANNPGPIMGFGQPSFGFGHQNFGFGGNPSALNFANQMPSLQGSPLGMAPMGTGGMPPPSQLGVPMQMIQQQLATGQPLPPQLQQLLMSNPELRKELMADPAIRQKLMADPEIRKLLANCDSHVTATIDNASGGMDFDRAVRTLANNFEKVKDGGGTISLDKLKTIANSPPGAGGVSPEMQTAAKYLVDNPEEFKKLETADEKKAALGSKADGKVGLTDLTAILPTLKGGVGDKQLWDDLMSNKDGLFNGRGAFHFDDIKKIAEQGVYPDGSKATSQQQAAAAQLWGRKDLLMAADSADKGGYAQAGQLGDRKISAKDVEIMQQQATAGATRKDLSPSLASFLTLGMVR